MALHIETGGMFKARKHYPRDRIKNQGAQKTSRLIRQNANRVMTAKLKKELVQRKRNGSNVTSEAFSRSGTGKYHRGGESVGTAR